MPDKECKLVIAVVDAEKRRFYRKKKVDVGAQWQKNFYAIAVVVGKH